mgnify:CR=1 FL=1
MLAEDRAGLRQAVLRRDAEHADHVGFFRLVVRPPVAHLLVLQYATLVALLHVGDAALNGFVHCSLLWARMPLWVNLNT